MSEHRASPQAAPKRRPGRPRSAEAEQAILGAALGLAAEMGLSRMTMEGVAARAGVGKATIYRRWSSKEALLLDAWATCVRPPELPDTGSLRDDVRLFLGGLVSMRDPQQTKVFPQMIAAARVNPEVEQRYMEFVAQRREPMRTLLRRGVDRGELPEGTDLEILHDVLVAPLFYRWLVTEAAVDQAAIDRWVAMALDGAVRT